MSIHQLRPYFALLATTTASSALAETAAVPGVPATSFVQGVLGLLLVIALLLGALWAMRRIGAAGVFARTEGMRVVAALSVGPRERIVLLEVGDAWVVIGITPTQMRTLHTLPKGDMPIADTVAAGNSFATWLKKVSERPHDAS